MRRWTSERVAELDDRGALYSPALTKVETREYLLFVAAGTESQSCVRRFQTDPGRVEAAIDGVLDQVRSAGGTGMRWVVNPRTTPDDMVPRLRRRGFELAFRAETLYRDLGTPAEPDLPDAHASDGISIREARADEEIDAFERLGEIVFHEPPAPSRFLERLRSQTHRSIETTGHSPLFVAYDGAVPIGRGGVTVTGAVGRFWSAGVLPDHRSKGAYQLLTRERCRAALGLGAQLAITHANVATSGDILKRRGFRSAGPYDYYLLRWGEAVPSIGAKSRSKRG
jgi:hypothetical protein